MRHPHLLKREDAVLLIVDVQESFRKHINDFANLTRNISIMAEAAKILKLPVVVTEQYPQGLGNIVAEISACLGDHKLFEKSCFSCCGSEPFMSHLEGIGRKQIIITGIEAHVCVNQTVHDLIESGYQVHLVVDAISSRNPKNKDIGIDKMTRSGAILSSVETSLFEMLVESNTETFKSVQRLVK
ncbi:MAG: hydrolase [Leptolyngbya sp.]|nr:hydrolase [Candidatus Melainabacteria bacterium]